MTPEQLREMEARATKGPWAFYDNDTDERIDGEHTDRRVSLRTTWKKKDKYGSVLPEFVAWLDEGIENPSDADLILTLRNLALPFADLWAAAEKIASNNPNSDDSEGHWTALRTALARLKEMKK